MTVTHESTRGTVQHAQAIDGIVLSVPAIAAIHPLRVNDLMQQTNSKNHASTFTQIEIINPDFPRGAFRHALFDFDGTLSLIREGWQDVMIPMMLEFLRETGTSESDDELTAVVKQFVTRLTGKQTIYQMFELKAQIEKRGGKAKDPLEYKHIYLERLWDRIQHRVADLKAGVVDPDAYLVPGSVELLEALKERNVELYLASGTDYPYVVDECAALGLSGYFAEHIYGALDEYKKFSKKMIIEKIFAEHGLAGPELIAFGDGYVEIENTKEVGGVAVGVASNEAERRGVDEWKRNRLIEAGADLIIPDYREIDRLAPYLFGENGEV